MSRVYTRKFDWDAARALRAMGMSYVQIGDLFGVSDSAIRLACDNEARAKTREYGVAYQRSGVCEDCGGSCTPPAHPGRTKHAHTDGLILCNACRGRRNRNGVTVRDGRIIVRCGSCRAEKPVTEFSARVGKAIAADKAPRVRTCRSCETRKRQNYRERHKIPCRSCGAPCLPANEKGRTGKDTRLCRTCWATPERRRLAA